MTLAVAALWSLAVWLLLIVGSCWLLGIHA